MVSHDGDYTPLQMTATGRLKVDAEVSVSSDFVYAEDDPNSSGSLGAYVLAVRRDTLAINTSLDGDYADFKVNDRGGLWTVPVGTVADDAADNEYPVKVGSRSAWGTLNNISADNDRADLISDKYRRVYVNNGSNISIRAAAVTAGLSEVEIKSGASRLPGRRLLMFQNLSNKECYIGETGVSASSGIVLAARASMTLDIGQDVPVYILGSAAGQNVRVLEMA
jgi:hypothetical protein